MSAWGRRLKNGHLLRCAYFRLQRTVGARHAVPLQIKKRALQLTVFEPPVKNN